MGAHSQQITHEPGSLILHWAAPYDLLLWFLMRGKEQQFREKLLQTARLRSGESVLDVGCGTGTLAIAMKRQFGNSIAVAGIDASPEMIARARGKAAKAGLDIDFLEGTAASLPFSNGQFDVVFTTMMLHHLGPKLRSECASEVRRVLKPDGRWFVVDFEGSARQAGGILSLFHRHGHIKPGGLRTLIAETGLKVVDEGPVGFRNLRFLLATENCSQGEL